MLHLMSLSFKEAFFFAKECYQKKKLINGDQYLCHPLRMCYRLSELRADTDTLITCILHDVLEDSSEEKEIFIKENFGIDVLILIKQIAKLNELHILEDMEKKTN